MSAAAAVFAVLIFVVLFFMMPGWFIAFFFLWMSIGGLWILIDGIGKNRL